MAVRRWVKVLSMAVLLVTVIHTTTASTTPAGTSAAPTQTEAAPTQTEAAATQTEAAATQTEAAPTQTEAAPTQTQAAATETATDSTGLGEAETVTSTDGDSTGAGAETTGPSVTSTGGAPASPSGSIQVTAGPTSAVGSSSGPEESTAAGGGLSTVAPSGEVPTTAPGGGQETTESTTTTAAPSTTTAQPNAPQPPNYGNVNMLVKLTLKFNQTYDERLSNPNTDLYKELQLTVVVKITQAFFFTFAFLRVDIKGFKQGSTIVNYDVVYDTAAIMATSDPQAATDGIFEDIQNDALPELANDTINGAAVDAEYMNTIVIQELNDSETAANIFLNDPCSNVELCSGCFDQCTNVGSSEGVLCGPHCPGSTALCVEGDIIPICVCALGYIEFADTCADRWLVIGVPVAVGGALLISFFVATIVLCCRNKKLSKQPKGGSKSDPTLEHEKGIPQYTLEGTDTTGMDQEAPSMESFGKLDDDEKSTRSKEKDVERDSVLGDSSPEEGRSGSEGGGEVARDYSQGYQEEMPFTARIWRPSVYPRPRSGAPEALSANDIELEPSRIEYTDAYRNFRPQLDNIDHTVNYFSTPLRVNLRNSGRTPYRVTSYYDV